MANPELISPEDISVRDNASIAVDTFLQKKFGSAESKVDQERAKVLLSSFVENEQNLTILEKLLKKEVLEKEKCETVLSSIFDLVASETLPPEQLPYLIRSFSYSETVNAELEKTYGQDSCIEWDNFGIVLKPKLFNKKENGKYEYDIAHNISHEIAHSIIEILGREEQLNQSMEDADETETFDLDDVVGLLAQLDNLLGADSKHINELQTKGKANPELVKTERLAEVIGAFMASGKNKEKFLSKRTAAIISNDSTKQSGEQIEDINSQIFNLLDNSWPTIQKIIQGHDFDEGFSTQPIIPSETSLGESEYASGASIMPSGNAGQLGGRSFGESPSLGKNDPDNGLIGLFKNFISSFAGEVPNVN